MNTAISTPKKAITGLFIAVLFFMVAAPFASADSYNSNKHNKNKAYYPMYQQTYQTYTSNDTEALLSQIRVLLAQLQTLQARQNTYTYQQPIHWLQEYNAQKSKKYPYTHNSNYTYWYDNDDSDDEDDDNDDEDVPEVTTDDAEDINENQAELNGEIEMNDFENGVAFFVYGEDEGDVEDVEDEDSYNDVSSNGDNLQKVLLSSSLDDDRSFSADIYNLDEDTEIYYRICVAYEDEDDDDALECGDVESFETDNN